MALPLLSQQFNFENAVRLELDRAIKAAAAAAVAASKPCPSTALFPLEPTVSIAMSPLITSLPLTTAQLLPTPSEPVSIMSAMLKAHAPNSIKVESLAPLLQLAVRQAITECLAPLKLELNIEGQLTVSTPVVRESSDSGKVVIAFGSANPKAECTSTSTCVDCPTSIASITQSPTTSKRKSYHPTKYFPTDSVPVTVTTELSPASTGSPISIPPHTAEYSMTFSGSTSPSTTDSGALDLSRAGSLSGSAPITPLKALTISQEQFNYHSFGMLPQANLLEFYQKQLLNPVLFESQQLPMPENEKPIPANEWQSPSKSAVGRKRAGYLMGTPTPRRPNASRRFPCNQCREEFLSLHNLEEHTMAMHGTYRCHICKAQFTQRSNLQRHALKHVGFKPFECRVCQKAYYRKDHLMRHMEMGHPGFSPRDNITVHLTSSESLDFLNRTVDAAVDGLAKVDRKTEMAELDVLSSPLKEHQQESADSSLGDVEEAESTLAERHSATPSPPLTMELKAEPMGPEFSSFS